jgi:hypothetical protein
MAMAFATRMPSELRAAARIYGLRDTIAPGRNDTLARGDTSAS